MPRLEAAGAGVGAGANVAPLPPGTTVAAPPPTDASQQPELGGTPQLGPVQLGTAQLGAEQQSSTGTR
jgi:hypothetical protein